MEIVVLTCLVLIGWYVVKLSGQLHDVEDALRSISRSPPEDSLGSIEDSLERINNAIDVPGLEQTANDIKNALDKVGQILVDIKDDLNDFKMAWEDKNEGA